MTWVSIDKSWHDTSVDYCDVCGSLLIRRAFEFTRGSRTLRACREDDVRLLDVLEAAPPWEPTPDSGSRDG